MTIDQPDLDDLREMLDASFGDGPALPAPLDRLAAGHRSLRRRRRAGVAGSAVVAVVVVASFAVLGPGGTGPQGADPVSPAPSLAPPSASTAQDEARKAELDLLAREAAQHAEQVRMAQLVSTEFPAALDVVDGTLVVKDGWRVTKRVEEPLGYQPPKKSLGVVVTDGDQVRWMLLTIDRDGGSASADDAGKGYSRFEDWLASMVALQGGPAQDPLVEVAPDDRVLPAPGTTLVDVQEIDVIEGYTSPGDRVAEVRRDGRTWFVVIRGHGVDAELIPVDAEVLPNATLAALLTYVGQQAESGEGVR